MKKILSMILMLVLLGCGGKKEVSKKEVETKREDQQILTFAMASDPKHMDPALNSESVAGALINNLFEGLMREIDGELKPGIAKEYTLSTDKKSYNAIPNSN